jgi:UDP-N-acetylglucosamine 2-epimerase
MRDVLREELPAARQAARSMDLPRSFYFATVHRQENTDDPARLSSILRAFARLPRPVVFAAHPRTRQRMRALGLAPGPNVSVREPLAYRDTLGVALRAKLVLTDSGGLQKEAFLLGTPCVTLRDTTEWVETLAGGANRLAGSDARAIVAAVRSVEAKPPRVRPGRAYGTGSAARRTAVAIGRFLARRPGRS